MDYHQYQKEVFDYLWSKYQKDKNFTFSVRQKASKGAKKNYFIGTEKSYYFGFTCWDIPVYFAGSAADLFNFFFHAFEDESLGVKFQYSMTKKPHDDQNRANLELGYMVLEELKKRGIDFIGNPAENKMLYFEINTSKEGYNKVEELMNAFEEVYGKISPIIDECIKKVKNKNPHWEAGRFAESRFNNLINKMHERIERFSQPGMTTNDQDEDDDDELLIPTKSLKLSNEQPALNTILYGPPGTGKTYHTINRAVAIANPQFDMVNSTREEIKAEYEMLGKSGQIEFITFHQSMSYEDFIEGIKPVEPREGDDFLKYEIKDGIFKRLCERASKVPESNQSSFSITDDDFEKAGFYKISLGDTSNPDDDQIYKWCIENGYIALGWGDAIDFTGKKENEIQQMVPGQLEKFAAQAVNYFKHYAKTGDYVIVSYGNLQFRAVGKITGDYEYKNVDGLQVHQFRKVDWLLTGVELPYEEIYDRQFSQQSIYKIDKRGIRKDFLVKTSKSLPHGGATPKNYVLIIDEINRGNVSQIFGELITLIEQDKRAGKDEALTVTLPYSKKPFTVPSNLYIIGTMNTADRSVEALDTALRRRFVFEEMEPRPELLHPKEMLCTFWNLPQHINVEYDDWLSEPYKSSADFFYNLIGMTRELENSIYDKDFKVQRKFWIMDDLADIPDEQFTGIRLDQLLEKINHRLSTLLSKDHTIGHAWLMNVFSLAELQAAFRNKILPLLQEFFYNDYAKIGLVLGKSIVKAKLAGQDLFAKFEDSNELASEYADKTIYTLANPFELSLDDFKSIYH